MGNADLHNLVDRLPEDVVRRIESGGPVTLVVIRENGRLEAREIDPDDAYAYGSDKKAFQKYVTDTSMLPKTDITGTSPAAASA